MNFVDAIAKTIQDLQANPTWQREALIGQGVSPRDANIMAQQTADKAESKQMVEMIRARLDAGQEISPQELLAIGSVNPELARVVVAMQKQQAPNNQYMVLPDGNIAAVDKNTGIASVVPFGSAAPVAPDMGDWLPLPSPAPTDSASQPSGGFGKPPAGLSPAGRKKWEETQIKLQSEAEEHNKRVGSADEILNSMEQAIDDALTHKGLEAATGLSALLPTVSPTTTGAEEKLETIKGKAFQQYITGLKEMSSSGSAGLGNTAIPEMENIIKSWGSLKTSQSEEDVKKNLQDMKNRVRKIKGMLYENNPNYKAPLSNLSTEELENMLKEIK